VYQKHKVVAEKRLRIEGRFVTKEQAFEILGIGQQDLLDNVAIQELLTEHSDQKKRFNTTISDGKYGGRTIKIANFQALIDNNYTHLPNITDVNKDITEGEGAPEIVNLCFT